MDIVSYFERKLTLEMTFRAKTDVKFQPEWLSSEILDCMKERNKCKLNGNISLYKELRNKVTNMIKTAKTKTYQTKIEDGKSDPRTIWKLF